MSRLYGNQHRELQDAFSTRKLADRIEQIACKTEFDEESKGFIEAMDMFFLATVDHNGRPTVSYKGCRPRFRQDSRHNYAGIPELRRQRIVPFNGKLGA